MKIEKLKIGFLAYNKDEYLGTISEIDKERNEFEIISSSGCITPSRFLSATKITDCYGKVIWENIANNEIYLFKKFLKDTGNYKEFKKQLLKSKGIGIKTFIKYNHKDMNRFLTKAFEWDKTEQGHEKWRELNEKWERVIYASRQTKA